MYASQIEVKLKVRVKVEIKYIHNNKQSIANSLNKYNNDLYNTTCFHILQRETV